MKSMFFIAAMGILALLAGSSAVAQGSSSATIAGKWHFILDTEGGDREADALLQLDGEKVSGKWGTDTKKNGGDNIAGTYVAKELILDFPTDTEVGPGNLKFKGHLGDDRTISGDWYFGDYSGTFKATRLKD